MPEKRTLTQKVCEKKVTRNPSLTVAKKIMSISRAETSDHALRPGVIHSVNIEVNKPQKPAPQVLKYEAKKQT